MDGVPGGQVWEVPSLQYSMKYFDMKSMQGEQSRAGERLREMEIDEGGMDGR